MGSVHFENTAAIGHAWILSSPVPEEALHRAQEIAAGAVCLAGHDVPCGNCRGCRKAAAGVHPDIIRVCRETDRSGKLRREITVGQIRDVAADAAVLPNESERKVYIIEEAETMNLNAQNAALKLLEEPPKTVIFLLCTVNPDLLLETVRSRCLSVSVSSGSTETSGDGEKRAEGFLKAMRSGEAEAVWRWIAKNETNKLDETASFVEAALQGTVDMLCGRADPGRLTPDRLMQLERLLEQCTEYLKVNVNAKHVFSLLAVHAPADESQPRRMGETS
ncbi:MAG: hypothetical protein IKS55_10075 [Oscillospiraceae bacterium]|nr:hypothetical protein [Oscillospiraceae bacterium]